jgi:4-hydroxy-tetrahydrodipicolinate synthase
VVSVASNVIPREVSRMVKAFAAGRVAEARKIHAKFYPIFKDLFIETNPAPVKAALAMMGKLHEEYRLPICPMSEANRATLRATLKKCGVIR